MCTAQSTSCRHTPSTWCTPPSGPAYLPSIARWAEVVAGLLRPGGRLHLRETHPVVWALGRGRDEDDDQLVLHGAYFETDVPVHFDRLDTYASSEQNFSTAYSFEWSHRLGEIVRRARLHAAGRPPGRAGERRPVIAMSDATPAATVTPPRASAPP
jgi:hypothetical protein